ncbi:type-F conjugative transfer system secretin TraK [Legionella septentrionalis]|uniref:type-F conjugative transfer system secretin TraK n=1 Tax=Legionella septentrionalis TaxID=2498109 RepID=UPI000F8CCA09|nr:type-F conjugative transfer system secretin TraK [Legionella septentrionalis]RUQ96649.1 type-F conjugative transfer system secretin TraK [Legionella septentrionalis]
MQKISIFLAGILFSNALFAGSQPSEIKFEEGEQLNASLSKLNFNRIFVEGERIVKVSYPEHTFIVDKTETEDELDGSVYIKPLVDFELTVFFTTDEDHHFSLTVKPNETLGETLKLVRKGQKGYDYAQSKQNEQYRTDDAMTSLMEGKIPDGFSEIKIKPSSFYFHKSLKLTLLKQYRGNGSSAYIYRVENKSKEFVELTPSLFENNKLLSLELSEKSLPPKQMAYLYGFYRDEHIGLKG